jgi:hypothetical protein
MSEISKRNRTWDLAADGSRPSAAGTASAALKLATLNAVLAFATCTLSALLRHPARISGYSSRLFGRIGLAQKYAQIEKTSFAHPWRAHITG